MYRRAVAAAAFLAVGAHCAPKAAPAPAPEPAAPVPHAALAAEVEAALDRSVDPCTDFYAFACGGWTATHEIPADKAITGRSFDVISDRNRELLRDLLEGWAANPDGVQAHDQLGAYYRSCMDTARIDGAGLAPIQPWLDEVAAIGNRKQLMAVVARLHAEGEGPLFGVWIAPDAKNPDLYILQMSQGGLGLPDRSYYLREDPKKTEKLAGYQALLTRLFELAGDTPEAASAAAERVVAIETKLAEASWPREDLYDSEKTYNKLDRAGLKKAMPRFDVDGFLAAGGLAAATQINVATPSYFEKLDVLLQRQDLGALKDYLRAQVLVGSAEHLSAPFDEASFDFYGRQMSGQEVQRERWKRCVARTDRGLGDLMGQAYVDAAFPGESKAIALEMVRDIEAAFEQGLSALSWMDDDTRARAVEKAKAVTNKIGYPDTWKDYSALSFGDDWYANHHAAVMFEVDRHVARVEKPVDRSEWFMSASTVNAYYNPTANEIVFPAGILQPPFFDASYPAALNHGAIGMVIGHELTHGFDDDGRRYDGTGQMTDWWAPDAVTRFEEAAACVDARYDTFEVQPGLFVNGELTLGENIADLGGIKQAHTAYRGWVARHGEEAPVAGFTGDQLVFLGFAQAWCTNVRPELEQMRVATDSHAPPRFRVNGALSNLPAFGEAFACAEGSPMRPAEICTVW